LDVAARRNRLRQEYRQQHRDAPVGREGSFILLTQTGLHDKLILKSGKSNNAYELFPGAG